MTQYMTMPTVQTEAAEVVTARGTTAQPETEAVRCAGSGGGRRLNITS